MVTLRRAGNGLLLAVKRISELFYKAPLRYCLITAVLTELLVEMLCRHSFTDAFVFVFQHPVMFVLGVAIVFFTYSLSWLVKKGAVMWLTFFIIWFGLALTDCIVLIYRAAPLSGSDFAILGSVLPIIGVYLTPFQLVLIALGIVGAVGLIVFLWIKAPAGRADVRVGLKRFLIFALVFALLITSLGLAHLLPRNFSDINRAYADYGFPYGFLCSIFVQGINKPSDYDGESIEAVLERIEAAKSKSGAQGGDVEKPNVIYVQLESFFDINSVLGLELSENVIPNFTALKNSCPSGYLSVPLVGAGTANTEFEILTGMDIDFFGAGEYPYTSVLDENTCESVAYMYKSYGYKAHAMHNNTGTFYGRHTVYSNLGFDTFTPLECMYGVEYNALEWAKDSCLAQQIKETLLSSEERDFIFTVSVQAHGKYPEEMLGDGSDYLYGYDDISGLETERLENMYLYYVNQIRGTDGLIGELIEFLEGFDEKTVVVFYGDHLPYLELEAEQVKNGDLYQTEYILWSNYELGEDIPQAKDIEAYQLSAYVFEVLGLDGGIMSDIHTYLRDDEDYIDLLQLVEYDMLFGERYAYGEGGAYQPTTLRYGIRETAITGISYVRTGESGEKLIISVKGENFNEFSKIYVNGKNAGKTEYISENELKIATRVEEGAIITVAQEADDGTVFRVTNECVFE